MLNILDKLKNSMINQFNIYDNYIVDNYNFDFMGEFILTNSQYFLTKKKVICEYDNREYVFAKKIDILSKDYIDKNLLPFSDYAMNHFVKPDETHMSTIITLFISSNSIDETLKKQIPKIKKRKSYMFGLKGYSYLRLILLDNSKNELIYNSDSKDIIHFYKEALK